LKRCVKFPTVFLYFDFERNLQNFDTVINGVGGKIGAIQKRLAEHQNEAKALQKVVETSVKTAENAGESVPNQ